MELTEEEREVVGAMRASERAFKAIHQYAIKFEGDRQALTTADMAEDYRESYNEAGSADL